MLKDSHRVVLGTVPETVIFDRHSGLHDIQRKLGHIADETRQRIRCRAMIGIDIGNQITCGGIGADLAVRRETPPA